MGRMDISLSIATGLYSIALIADIWVIWIALLLFSNTAKDYWWTWLSLCLGLAAMAFRHLNALLNIPNEIHYDIVDPILSLCISVLLLFGLLTFKRMMIKGGISIERLTSLLALDPLTGSLSRTAIHDRITGEYERMRRNKLPFAVLELDIDRFKLINDTYGHKIGDEILINLIKRVREILRPTDLIGRIGGDEFLILLPETEQQQVTLVAQRLQTAIASEPFLTTGSLSVSVTVSIGIAIAETSQSSAIKIPNCANDLIEAADMAMYQAKNAGRNRVSGITTVIRSPT